MLKATLLREAAGVAGPSGVAGSGPTGVGETAGKRPRVEMRAEAAAAKVKANAKLGLSQAQGPVEGIKLYAASHAAKEENFRHANELSSVLQSGERDRARKDFIDSTRAKVLSAAQRHVEERKRKEGLASGQLQAQVRNQDSGAASAAPSSAAAADRDAPDHASGDAAQPSEPSSEAAARRQSNSAAGLWKGSKKQVDQTTKVRTWTLRTLARRPALAPPQRHSCMKASTCGASGVCVLSHTHTHTRTRTRTTTPTTRPMPGSQERPASECIEGA